ncbi:MAG: NupC/NupG family nucleoside CNT transporter [Deltaproteobacteria bacterium]|nr:NupC/NupG family nucleoside CNT transporter [Deltaproteobacteria bacterium]
MDIQKVISFLGIFVLIFIAWLFSNNKRKFPFRVVFWGVALQVIFVWLVMAPTPTFWLPIKTYLHLPSTYDVFKFLGDMVSSTLDFTNAGASFVFGDLGDKTKNFGDKSFGFINFAQLGIFAFRVLPTIIFVSALMSVLYYLNIMQVIVKMMAIVMKKFMGVSGAESLSCAANVFMGQTEAPLVIKPYVATMTMSELLTLMVGGMATVAGGVMAAYVSFGISPIHLITASVLSAPAAIVLAKIIFPETGTPLTMGEVKIHIPKANVNLIDSAASGASSGLKLALNVAAMLIAFLALVSLADVCVTWAGVGLAKGLGYLGFSAQENWISFLLQKKLNLNFIFGALNAPFAWIMGVPWNECFQVGTFLGQKIVMNEFVAYINFSQVAEQMSNRAQVITIFALCGFANFSSIGIQIGGIGGIAPDRRHDLAKLGIRALIGGALASYMTANIAGLML